MGEAQGARAEGEDCLEVKQEGWHQLLVGEEEQGGTEEEGQLGEVGSGRYR